MCSSDLNVVTVLHASASNGNISIPNGSTNQLKIIAMQSTSGGSFTLSGNLAHGGNILFSAAGNSATLLFVVNKWVLIGGNARLV